MRYNSLTVSRRGKTCLFLAPPTLVFFSTPINQNIFYQSEESGWLGLKLFFQPGDFFYHLGCSGQKKLSRNLITTWWSAVGYVASPSLTQSPRPFSFSSQPPCHPSHALSLKPFSHPPPRMPSGPGWKVLEKQKPEEHTRAGHETFLLIWARSVQRKLTRAG